MFSEVMNGLLRCDDDNNHHLMSSSSSNSNKNPKDMVLGIIPAGTCLFLVLS